MGEQEDVRDEDGLLLQLKCPGSVIHPTPHNLSSPRPCPVAARRLAVRSGRVRTRCRDPETDRAVLSRSRSAPCPLVTPSDFWLMTWGGGPGAYYPREARGLGRAVPRAIPQC